MSIGTPEVVVIVGVALIMSIPVTAAVFLINIVAKQSRAQKDILRRLEELERRVGAVK